MRKYHDYTMGQPLPGLAAQLHRLWERDPQPVHVVETGTYNGQGTTKTLVDAYEGRQLLTFVTMEADRSHWEAATDFLERYAPWADVECWWGLSVDYDAALRVLESDPILRQWRTLYPDIAIDDDVDPFNVYKRELEGTLFSDSGGVMPTQLLQNALAPVKYQRPLVCLDSAGGIGEYEYREFRRIMGTEPFLLVLDDVRHIKHFRSLADCEQDPMCTVHYVSPGQHAWALIEHC